MQRRGDVRRFYRRKLPRDSNWDSRTVTWHCHRRNHRWKYRRIDSVGDSIGTSHYIHNPSTDTLFLCFSFFFFLIPPLPSQTAANHPSQVLSPILNTSTQVSYTLYVVTISVSYGFYHFLYVNLSFLVLTFKCEYYCFFSICILLTYILIWLLFVKETCSMNV